MNLQTKAALLVSGLVLVVAPAVAQAESKTHVAGTPGTPFSKCVTAMAKLANGSTKSPKTACASLSKKHVAGTPGTPFSACVSAGAKLLETTNP